MEERALDRCPGAVTGSYELFTGDMGTSHLQPLSHPSTPILFFRSEFCYASQQPFCLRLLASRFKSTCHGGQLIPYCNSLKRLLRSLNFPFCPRLKSLYSRYCGQPDTAVHSKTTRQGDGVLKSAREKKQQHAPPRLR